MQFGADPYKKEEIYKKYLREINGVKFTFREVDTIACILHNRKEKKIASILSISPKTVNTHIYNIMSKLGYTSRDFIIDFVEKSGKLQHLRQYYFCLTIESFFKKYLEKIGSALNRRGQRCILYTKTEQSVDCIIEKLIYYLELASIKIINPNNSRIVDEVDVILYALKDKFDTIESLQKNSSVNHHIDSKKKDPFILLLGNADIPTIKNFECIDLRVEEDFYHAIFKLITKIIKNTEVDEAYKDFQKEYNLLQESWRPDISVSLHEPQFIKEQSPIRLKLLGLVLLAIICGILFFYKQLEEEEIDISSINQEFAEFITKFSADNITNEERLQANYALLNRVEEIVEKLSHKDMAEYFDSTQVSERELLNCLYVMHSLANQYTFFQHDGEKARKLLSIAMSIAHNFVGNKNKVEIDFEKLSANELYLELYIVKDLPEIYTRILYLLGRTFTYQGDLKESIKYFNLAKDLGYKLGLFEGYLSSRSGIDFVRNKEIVDHLNRKEFDEAKSKTLESIAANKELLADQSGYKINYKPGNADPEIIFPKDDMFNRAFCSEALTKAYARLIFMGINEGFYNEEYLDKITKLHLGSSEYPGLIDLGEKVIKKRSASMYNNLGNILLKLYEYDISFKNLKNELLVKLISIHPDLNFISLEETKLDDLYFIQKIFFLAKSNSRNTDYARADSYDGLMRIDEMLLDLLTHNPDKFLIPITDQVDNHLNDTSSLNAQKTTPQKYLKEEIEIYKNLRDKLNNDLNRKDWRLKPHI